MGEIAKLIPPLGRKLAAVKGADIIQLVGEPTIKSVIASLLCGENIRNLTEGLTRRRLTISNGALLMLFIKGCADPNFIKTLPEKAYDEYKTNSTGKEKIILQWLLGLTNKGVQNILRGDEDNIKEYIQTTEQSVNEAIKTLEQEIGSIDGHISISQYKALLDWRFIIRLFTAVGAQTLAIRGAEKSLYGKLFERLVLGSLLTILGFEFIEKSKGGTKTKIFWLSDRGDKRESDATLLLEPGKGIRFDMGFIGVGNTEISLDKVSRFERYMDYGNKRHFMLTFIIVDRIGEGSRIVEQAKGINGTLIQMSMAYWPQIVAQKLAEKTGFKHVLSTMPHSKLGQYISEQIKNIDIRKFV